MFDWLQGCRAGIELLAELNQFKNVFNSLVLSRHPGIWYIYFIVLFEIALQFYFDLLTYRYQYKKVFLIGGFFLLISCLSSSLLFKVIYCGRISRFWWGRCCSWISLYRSQTPWCIPVCILKWCFLIVLWLTISFLFHYNLPLNKRLVHRVENDKVMTSFALRFLLMVPIRALMTIVSVCKQVWQNTIGKLWSFVNRKTRETRPHNGDVQKATNKTWLFSSPQQTVME